MTADGVAGAADESTSVERADEVGAGADVAVDAPGVVVLGAAAEEVADRVAALRTAGRPAAGFVGDPGSPADDAAAAEMARELFGDAGGVEPL